MSEEDNSTCTICDKPIFEHQTRVNDDEEGLVHARCLGIEVEDSKEFLAKLEKLEERIDQVYEKVKQIK